MIVTEPYDAGICETRTEPTRLRLEETILEACCDPPLPTMRVIEQVRETDPIADAAVYDQAAEAVEKPPFEGNPDSGEIAVCVGSRSISNFTEIVASVVIELSRSEGGERSQDHV